MTSFKFNNKVNRSIKVKLNKNIIYYNSSRL